MNADSTLPIVCRQLTGRSSSGRGFFDSSTVARSRSQKESGRRIAPAAAEFNACRLAGGALLHLGRGEVVVRPVHGEVVRLVLVERRGDEVAAGEEVVDH